MVKCLPFGVLAALALYAVIPNAAPIGFSGWLLLANIALLVTTLTLNVISNEERVAEFYFHLYFILFFLIPGYIHLSTGRFPFYNMIYADEYVFWASSCVLMFNICFLAGYAATRSRLAESPRVRRVPTIRKNVSFFWLVLLYETTAVAVALVFGIDRFLASRAEIDVLLPESTPAVLIGFNAPRILSFVALLVCAIGLKHRFSWSGLAGAVLALAIFLTLNFPTTIARFVLFSYIIIFMTVFFTLTRKLKISLVFLFFVGQFTVFPAISALSRGDIQDVLSTSVVDYFIDSGDFDGFQSTISVVRYAQEGGYHYGLKLLSAALFFLPREYWADKSRGTGADAAAFNGYDFVNISSPLPSEFFADLGIIGTAIGAAVFGALLASVDLRICRYRAADEKLLLTQPATLIGFLFIILRGSLVAVLGPLVLTYCVIWIAVQWTLFKSKVTARAIQQRKML